MLHLVENVIHLVLVLVGIDQFYGIALYLLQFEFLIGFNFNGFSFYLILFLKILKFVVGDLSCWWLSKVNECSFLLKVALHTSNRFLVLLLDILNYWCLIHFDHVREQPGLGCHIRFGNMRNIPKQTLPNLHTLSSRVKYRVGWPHKFLKFVHCLRQEKKN